MGEDDSLDAAYFEGVFDGDDDPWDLASSPYEAAKFDATIAAIGGRHYARAIEIGCAHGVLTERLAPLCDDLLAIDISARALALASARLAGVDGVRFDRCGFPRETPGAGELDLAILSEVVYYWGDVDIGRAADWLATAVSLGGHILLVHFTGDTDYPQTGDDAVAKLRAHLGGAVAIEREDRQDRYRLDLWRRR